MERAGYLDFHTHILPGVDNEAMDMETTRRMLQLAYQQGVRTILATPHNYPGGRPQDNEQIRALCSEVEKEAQNIHQDFRVLAGNEILYRESILFELEKQHILTLADSRYLLIEFLPGEYFSHIKEGLYQLILEEYYPVVAHVEHIRCLMERSEFIKELVEMGCYMQVDCRDIMGGPFNSRAKALHRLMEKNRIHFLGSNCHDEINSPPIMEDCIRQLQKKIPEQTLKKVIFDNPDRFLQKKYL